MADVLPIESGNSQLDEKSREMQLDRLDELLSLYLSRVHEYEQARTQLSETLSSGFFSLAQANFNNATRTRYGQDYYDERMQACRRVVVSSDPGEKVTFRVTPGEGSESSMADSKEEEQGDTKDEMQKDPIRWFGILVPPALRDAQTDFQRVLEGPVPRLASLIKEIRMLETSISRTRKSLKKL